MVYLDDASTTMSDNQKQQLNNASSARVQTNDILLWYKVYSLYLKPNDDYLNGSEPSLRRSVIFNTITLKQNMSSIVILYLVLNKPLMVNFLSPVHILSSVTIGFIYIGDHSPKLFPLSLLFHQITWLTFFKVC